MDLAKHAIAEPGTDSAGTNARQAAARLDARPGDHEVDAEAEYPPR